MPAIESPIGLVLAGGLGRRLGRPKGELPFEGRGLAARAARVLATLCRGVVVSIRPGAANPAPGYPAVEDGPPAGRGPLAGLAAAFDAVGDDADLLVLACDYPRVEADLLRRLLGARNPHANIVLPRDPRGRDHPLVAVWRASSREPVTCALAQGRFRVGAVVAACNVVRLDASAFAGIDLASSLRNVNRPEDLAALGGG